MQFVKILQLLDLFMSCYSLQDRIVLLKLDPVRSILLVLGGNIPRCSGHTAVLVLGALKDHLDSVAFLSNFFRFYYIRAANVLIISNSTKLTN